MRVKGVNLGLCKGGGRGRREGRGYDGHDCDY
jgi:hypothetical protein